MFLFLSSGVRERYRQDVLRAIAQPAGSILQFRYDEVLLSANVLNELRADNRNLVGKSGLIAFLDRKDSTADQEPDLVPCRYVTIHRASRHGTTVTVQLKLGQFPKGREVDLNRFIEGFNHEARQQLGDLYPRWEKDATGKRVGNIRAAFWSGVKDNWESVAQLPVTATWEEVSGVWELIVKALQSREHFNTEPYFFLFRGIRTVDEGQTFDDRRTFVTPTDRGVYSLVSGKEYELLLYHFYPGDPVAGTPSPLKERERAAPSTDLKVSASNPLIEFTSGNTFRLDSGYDEKATRFVVGDAMTTTRGVFTISDTRKKMVAGEEVEQETNWFDLPVEIPRNWWWVGTKGALLASPVAVGPALAALANDKLDPTIRGWLVAFSIFGACAGGALTALLGKK